MNFSGCRISGVDMKSSYGRLSGSVTPTLGAASTSSWTPTGWTSLQNATADDSYVTVPLNFSNFVINSTSYSTAYVGSNLYITFGSPATVYSGLSASNPALNKLMIGSADYSFQRVAYKYFPDATLIRFEGYNTAGGTTPGNSNIIYECLFINPLRYSTRRSVIALMMGNAANAGASLFGVANTSSFYATGTLTASTSYVFEATNDTGTAWTLNTGSYIPLF